MKKLLVGLYSFVFFFWVVTSSSLNPVSSDPCHIDAWVRAPDLDPGQIIPGQVRIRANGTCDPVSEYSLILRFKERAWAKLPKPDIALPKQPDRNGNISKTDRNSVFRSPSSLFSHYSNPLWGKYTEDMIDPSLWDVIEEERIAFESKHRLNEDITPFSLREGLTHDFALLVPTTNYPPTASPINNNFVFGMIKDGTAEKSDEYIYLYSVEIKFNNGTTVEVPAGYTTFKSTGRSDNPGPEVITANLIQYFTSSDNLNVSLTINVTFPNGRTLEQGSTYNLTFTLCDWTLLSLVSSNAYTNYSLALRPPSMDIQTSTHDRWIQTLSPMNNYAMSSHFSSYQLSPTSSHFKRGNLCRVSNLERGADKSCWNVSTSKSLQVAPKAFPSFDTHYGSFESELSISFDIFLQEIKSQTQTVFDEDYYWVPTTAAKEGDIFWRPFTTQIPITISPNVKSNIPATHYLSSHARQPLFIDQSTIEELSQLSTEERDLLAPKSVPIIKRNTENVVRQRYHNKPLYYVGDTWHRKVLDGVSQSDSDLNTLLVQIPKD